MNKLVKRHLPDGTVKSTEAMCEKHINQVSQDKGLTLEVLKGSTGMKCAVCCAEAGDIQVREVPHTEIMKHLQLILDSIDKEDAEMVQATPPLLCLSSGFIHAMLVCGVDEEKLRAQTRKVLLTQWTKLTESKEIDKDR